MTVTIVHGEGSAKKGRTLGAKHGEKMVITTYHALSTEHHHLSNIVYPSPKAIVIVDAPNRQFMVEFADTLSQMAMIPCDRKGKCFTRRKAPNFIFCTDGCVDNLVIPENIEVVKCKK